MSIKTYRQLKPEQRREFKKLLLSVDELTKKQLDLLDRSILKALNDRRKSIKDVLSGWITIEEFKRRNAYLSNYIVDFFQSRSDHLIKKLEARSK